MCKVMAASRCYCIPAHIVVDRVVCLNTESQAQTWSATVIVTKLCMRCNLFVSNDVHMCRSVLTNIMSLSNEAKQETRIHSGPVNTPICQVMLPT